MRISSRSGEIADELQSQLPCDLAASAMQSNQSGTAEGNALVAKQSREAFVKELAAVGGTRIAFAGNVMPRETWARCLALAMASVGAIAPEAADAVMAILNSDLGNSSQLGTALLKEGAITRESAVAASTSLASILAERAKAKQG